MATYCFVFQLCIGTSSTSSGWSTHIWIYRVINKHSFIFQQRHQRKSVLKNQVKLQNFDTETCRTTCNPYVMKEAQIMCTGLSWVETSLSVGLAYESPGCDNVVSIQLQTTTVTCRVMWHEYDTHNNVPIQNWHGERTFPNIHQVFCSVNPGSEPWTIQRHGLHLLSQ
jgi:hypothetical protein